MGLQAWNLSPSPPTSGCWSCSAPVFLFPPPPGPTSYGWGVRDPHPLRWPLWIPTSLGRCPDCEETRARKSSLPCCLDSVLQLCFCRGEVGASAGSLLGCRSLSLPPLDCPLRACLLCHFAPFELQAECTGCQSRQVLPSLGPTLAVDVRTVSPASLRLFSADQLEIASLVPAWQ